MADRRWSARDTFEHLWGDEETSGGGWQWWGKPLCPACQVKLQMCQLFIQESARSRPQTHADWMWKALEWNGGYSEVHASELDFWIKPRKNMAFSTSALKHVCGINVEKHRDEKFLLLQLKRFREKLKWNGLGQACLKMHSFYNTAVQELVVFIICWMAALLKKCF